MPAGGCASPLVMGGRDHQKRNSLQTDQRSGSGDLSLVVGSIDLDELDLEIERRGDGALLVRVPSNEFDGQRLPDAVFSFRAGDPQFSFWLQRLVEQESAQ